MRQSMIRERKGAIKRRDVRKEPRQDAEEERRENNTKKHKKLNKTIINISGISQNRFHVMLLMLAVQATLHTLAISLDTISWMDAGANVK